MTNPLCRFITLICLTVLMYSCHTKNRMQEKPSSVLEARAIEHFKTGYEIIDNRTGSFALVIKEIKTRPGQIFPTVKFFVFDYSSSEDFYLQTLPRGTVNWIADSELLCESIPGRVTDQESGKKYIYDVAKRSVKPYKG